MRETLHKWYHHYSHFEQENMMDFVVDSDVKTWKEKEKSFHLSFEQFSWSHSVLYDDPSLSDDQEDLDKRIDGNSNTLT